MNFLCVENGIHMLLWIGLGVNPDFCQQIFGVPSPIQIDVDKITLPKLDNPLAHAVHSVIDQIRAERHRCMRVRIIDLISLNVILTCFLF